MNCTVRVYELFILFCAPVTSGLQAAPMQWTHFTIQDPLPGQGWGTAGTPLADYDGDGDLDIALSRRAAHIFLWYERRSDSEWVPHVLSDAEDLKQGLGSAALDVDADGYIDIVFDGVWFRNPGTLRDDRSAPWELHTYPGGGHDILAADLTGDGRQELLTFDGKELRVFDTATMTPVTLGAGFDHHGGLTPSGVGDIDGDGDPDLVIAGIWFENPGSLAETWPQHEWPHLPIPGASYGTSIRSWVSDLDGDGDNDIIYSDCDTSQAHVFWVRNDGKGAAWTRFQLPDPPVPEGSVEGTGSFHSLAVADFNCDGLPDIFGGEQEDPNQAMVAKGLLPMKHPNLKERGIVWLREPGEGMRFVPHVIQIDNPGWHDVSIGDVDGDGDNDIVSKVWHADSPNHHADYWRNDTKK